jgi:hypothetical protein
LLEGEGDPDQRRLAEAATDEGKVDGQVKGETRGDADQGIAGLSRR